MQKQKGRMPRIAKLTDAHGIVVVDFESGLLVRVGKDAELGGARAVTSPSAARALVGGPNAKLPRN